MLAVILIPKFDTGQLDFVDSGEVFDFSLGELERAPFEQRLFQDLASFGSCSYLLFATPEDYEQNKNGQQFIHRLESDPVPYPFVSLQFPPQPSPKRRKR